MVTLVNPMLLQKAYGEIDVTEFGIVNVAPGFRQGYTINSSTSLLYRTPSREIYFWFVSSTFISDNPEQ